MWQVDGNTLAANIDTWEIIDFEIFNVIGEDDPTVPVDAPTPIFDEAFWVDNLHTNFLATSLNINNPTFTITNFDVDGLGAANYYPGATLKYEITGGANMNFPANTVFEVFLRPNAGSEKVIGTIPLSAMPDAGEAEEFTFKLPFTNIGWNRLFIRADIRDYSYEINSGWFQVLNVNFANVEIDLDETPEAEKMELDGNTYLFPGSTVVVNYELGANQEIHTDDIQVVLEYNIGHGWEYMASQDFSNDADQSISGTLPNNIDMDGIDQVHLQIKLMYGDTKELITQLVDRPIFTEINEDQLPNAIILGMNTWKPGSLFSFHNFVKNSTAQNLIVERRYDGGVWEEVETIPTAANERKYSLHYAANFFDIVDGSEDFDGTPEFRVRWENGVPAGDNMALNKGYRIQTPVNDDLGIESYAGFVNIYHPYLTLSQNISKYYEFDVDEDNNGIGHVDIDVFYNHVGLPDAGTQVSAVLVNQGHNPEHGDPYIYLGSKDVGEDGQDNFSYQLSYEEIIALYGQDLPFGPVFDPDKALLNPQFTALTGFMPGEQNTIIFDFYVESPDWEYVNVVDFNLPPGVSFVSAEPILRSGGQLSVSAASGGQLIRWQVGFLDPLNDCGGGLGFCNYAVEIVVDVDPNFSTDMIIDWDIVGDEYGDPPHTGSGSVVVLNDSNPFANFEAYLYVTEKTSADQIQFLDFEDDVDFTGLNAQPHILTQAVDLTSLTPPLYLNYNWWDGDNINPLNEDTRPIFQYTVDNGATWNTIEEFPFNETPISIEPEWISEDTRFRWIQNVNTGNWGVWGVKVMSGESNLVNFGYQKVGVPATLAMARKNVPEEDPEPPVDYCLEFNNAEIEAYEFSTTDQGVHVNEEFDFDWNQMVADVAKTIIDPTLSVNDAKYAFGENNMEFALEFESDKAITEFIITFPAGVTPIDADIILNHGNTLTPDVDGQDITWTSDAGVVIGNVAVNFNVVFDVEDTFENEINVEWSITDADGTETGELNIYPYGAFPEGTEFAFYLGWIDPANILAENITEFGTFTAVVPDLATGTYNIWAVASYETIDDDEIPVDCGERHFIVFEDFFVIQEETPEAHGLAINSVTPDNHEDLDPSIFYYTSNMDIEYFTFGPFDDGVRFGFVLYNNMDNYYQIGDADLINGENSINLEIPTKEELDNLEWFNLYLMPYYGNEGDDIILYTENHHINEYLNINDGWGNESLDFWGTNETRYAISKSLAFYLGDDLDYNNHTLSFSYDIMDPFNPLNAETTPRLQVTDDGGATYTNIEWLLEPKSGVDAYTIDIPQPWLDNAENVHFRWIQNHPVGAWRIYDVILTWGESNWFNDWAAAFDDNPIFINELPEEATFACTDLNDANFNAYTWELIDEDPDPIFETVVNAGDEFEFEWTYDEESMHEEFPVGTEFYFYLRNTWWDLVEDPNTLEPIAFGPYVSFLGLVEATETMPEFIPTGTYHVIVSAEYTYMDVEEEVTCEWGIWLDVHKGSIFVVNELEVEDPFNIDLIEILAINDDDTDLDFYFGSEMSAKYHTYGPFEPGVRFGTILWNWGTDAYYTLGSQDATGEVSQEFEIPSKHELEEVGFDFNNGVVVAVVAYTGGEEDHVVLATDKIDVDNFLALNDGAGGIPSPNFDQNQEVGGVYTKRYAVTHSLAHYLGEGVDLNNHTLEFTYTELIPINPKNAQTTPRLQVTQDGGITYEDLVWLFETDDYIVEISQDWLNNAANVHFRWVQDYPSGTWTLDWNTIEFVYGETNVYENLLSNTFPINIQSMEFDCDDYQFSHFAYNWEPIDETIAPEFDVIVYSGAEFDFEWTYDEDHGADEFPEGTEFHFLLKYNGDVVVDPDTEEALVFGPYTTVDGVLEATEEMPNYIPTGIYEVYLVATYTYIENEEEMECVWGGDLDVNVYNQLFVENLVDEDVLNLTLVLPEDNAEFETEEHFDAVYTTFGEFPVDMNFAAVISKVIDGVVHYQVLGDNITTGVEQVIDAQMLDMPWYDPVGDNYINQYDFEIVAYEGDELFIGANDPIEITGDDFIQIQGADNNNWFNQNGERFALTKAFDLDGLQNVKLEFTYQAQGNIVVSSNTLPGLFISTDGGTTFEPLNVEQAPFGNQGYLDAANGFYNYQVEIHEPHNATHFMWKQDVNSGSWRISNIEITSGESNVFMASEKININLIFPQLANYTWSYDDENGLEPTLFNGSDFDFSWELNLDANDEPETAFQNGTIFDFILWDNVQDVQVAHIASIDNTGEFEANIPFLIERDDYELWVIATYDDEEKERRHIDNLVIFNQILRTVYNEQNPVLFAGNEATFTAQLENSIGTNDYEDVWFNLILKDWNGDWLLKAQQGLDNNFEVNIPPFVQGNIDFVIEATTDIMGVEGELLPEAGIKQLTTANDDFVNPPFNIIPNVAYNITTPAHHGQMRELYTENVDVQAYEKIKFQLKITEDLDNLTDDQLLVFEYSIDGGNEFLPIWEYPDARFSMPEFFEGENLNDWFNEEVDVPVGATNETILRWRIEESKGTVQIQNIELITTPTEYQTLPLTFLKTEVLVTEQRIDITDITVTPACDGGTVEIDYDIRGQFGEDVIYNVKVGEHILSVNNEDLEFGASDPVIVHVGILDQDISGSNVKFQLIAHDATVEEPNDVTVEGNLSEFGVTINVVEPIANVLLRTQNGTTEHESCEDQERIVVIHNVQENFEYQLRNHVDPSITYGDPVVLDLNDEDLTVNNADNDTYPQYTDGKLHISIGHITEITHVEVLVTAQDENATFVCEEIVPNTHVTFDVRPLYTLHYDMNSTHVWTEVADEQEFVFCTNNTDLRFRMGYYKDGNFHTTNAKWYRNDLNSPIGTTSQLNNFTVDANIFAIVDDGDCGEYQSVTASIAIMDKPEQPMITVDGNPILCDGEMVTLTATDGYNYYRWFRNGTAAHHIVGGNTQTLNVNQTGIYRVQVSDIPFNQGCYSVISNPVSIDMFEFNTVWFNTGTINLCHDTDGVAEVTVTNTQQGVTYHLVNDATDEVFATFSTSGSNSVTFTTEPILANSSFSILAERDDDAECNKMVSNNNLNINILPEYHILVSNGSFFEPATETYCVGQQLRVGTENGSLNLFGGSIAWYRDGVFYSSSLTVNANEAGVYNAKYTNGNGCEYFTQEVVIEEQPETPVITHDGEFIGCDTDQITLTATEGFDYYRWFKGGTQFGGNTQAVTVTQTGNYTVQVSHTADFECASNASAPITIQVVEFNNVNFSGGNTMYVCEFGDVDIEVNLGWQQPQSNVIYQLVDLLDDNQPLGDAFYMTANTKVVTVNISGYTEIGIVASHDIAGCEEEVHTSVLKVTMLSEYHILVNNGSFYEPATDAYCVGQYLTVGTENGSTQLFGGTISWYRDGVFYSNHQSIYADEAGVYKAKYTNGNGCEYFTQEVVIEEQPETPVITHNGEFIGCDTDQITLTATEGFDYYKWFRNGTQFGGNTQAVTVTQTGNYTVQVSHTADFECASNVSAPVTIQVVEFNNVNFAGNSMYLCEPGDVDIEVNLGWQQPQSNVVYQLVDLLDDNQPLGDAFYMTANTKLITVNISGYTEIGIVASHDIAGCEEEVHTNVLMVSMLPQYHTLVWNESVFEVANGDSYCENTQLSVGTEYGSTDIVNGNVTWFRNGNFYTNQQTFTTTEPGTYYAKFQNEYCTYYTEEVVIDVRPDRPVITYAGSTEFCEGEGSLVLTAPAGYETYLWFNNGVMLTNYTTTENHLNVVQTGNYSVVVVNSNGCQSQASVELPVTVHAKPAVAPYTVLENVLCEPGKVTVLVQNAEHNVMYQLFDAVTGVPSGDAKLGSNNLILVSDEISHNTIFEIRAYRIDVETCVAVFNPFEVTVNYLTIFVSGNTLIASIPPFNNVLNTGAISYQWYRNGSIISNGGTNQTLTIYDDAEYTVVVTTSDGCVLESVINRNTGENDITATVENEIAIYPNPASDFVNIKYSSEISEKLLIRVVDAKGAIIYDVEVNKMDDVLEHQIVLEGWARGAYVIQIVGQERVLDQMFIKF